MALMPTFYIIRILNPHQQMRVIPAQDVLGLEKPLRPPSECVYLINDFVVHMLDGVESGQS
jgi:hypothetical protein